MPPCPICRTKFRVNTIKKSLLAYQMINELEIFCTNRSCDWKGKLEEITAHLPCCMYKSDKLPEWYSAYLASREEELQKEEDAQAFLPDEARDMIKNQMTQPLTMRLFKPSDRPD